MPCFCCILFPLLVSPRKEEHKSEKGKLKGKTAFMFEERKKKKAKARIMLNRVIWRQKKMACDVFHKSEA